MLGIKFFKNLQNLGNYSLKKRLYTLIKRLYTLKKRINTLKRRINTLKRRLYTFKKISLRKYLYENNSKKIFIFKNKFSSLNTFKLDLICCLSRFLKSFFIRELYCSRGLLLLLKPAGVLKIFQLHKSELIHCLIK